MRLAPFYIEDGALGRRLLPLGIGVTDHIDVLIDGAPVAAVAAAVVDAYRHRAVRWDARPCRRWRRTRSPGTCLSRRCSTASVCSRPARC